MHILVQVSISARSKRWFKRLLAAAGLLLAVPHLVLLGQRVADESLYQPLVLARWAVGLALIAGFVALQRVRGSIFAGRGAVALWTLVLLLHLVAGVPAADAVEVDFLLPIGLVTVAWVAAVLCIVTALLAPRTVALGQRKSPLASPPRGKPVLLTGFVLPLGLRGPPLF